MSLKKTNIAIAILSCTALSLPAIAQNSEKEEILVVGKYLSQNEVNSIKSPTPIIDVPQSLSIFTADQIKERGITSIRGVVDYTPGVNTSQGEGHRDSVVFRGVRSTADFYLDGNRDDVQYFRSLYNLEQVEILRGPNALLFGRGGTGGIINRVTKKAQIGEQFTGYQTSVDSFGGYTAQVDANFVTGDSSSVRVNAHYDSLENHRDFFDGERFGFTATGRFELSERTTLDLTYEYADHERFIDRGIPSNDDNRPAAELDDITFADPENNFTTLEAHIFRAALQHQFSDTLKGNFSAFYGDYDKVYSNFFPVNFNEVENTVDLDGYIDETERENLILSANLVSEFSTGNVEHTLIFGGEYIDTSSDQFRLNAFFDTSSDDVETFSVSDPISFVDGVGVNANGALTTNTFSLASLNDDTQSDIQVTSLYIQDQIALSEHFDVVIGARYDRFDIEVVDIQEGGRLDTNVDTEVSPRLGLIYKPQENVSFYASYSESFLPRSGEQFADIDGTNDTLDPNRFENIEIGFKWDANSNLSFTAALFENEQTSPERDLDLDPSGATLVVQESEVSGFEFQVISQINDAWSLTANYSYLDGETDEGETPREIPENTFSIWNSFQVNSQFGLGLGATYQDESLTSDGGDVVLPSYVRVDAAGYYNVSDNLRIQLNVENLFDTEYFPNSHTDNNITVGAPINAVLSLSGKF